VTAQLKVKLAGVPGLKTVTDARVDSRQNVTEGGRH
jgi:hypothetical protein